MNKKFLHIFFSMSFLILFGKGLGFIRTALVASTYGAGFISDLYSFEDSLVNEIYAVFSTFLACSFIPRYLALDQINKKRIFNTILNDGLIIMISLTVFCMIFTKPLLKLLVPGYFSLYNIDNVIFITRINLIMLIITFLVNYFLTVLQAHEIFIYLSLESVILNCVVILYLLSMPECGILGLILCRIIAYSIFLILVTLKLRKSTNLKYQLTVSFADQDIVEMIKLSIPMLGITVLWQINYIIDKSMASGLESGSIANLNYANTIAMIIYNVVGYIISTYAYPTLSKIQNNGNVLACKFKEYLLMLLQLVSPIAVMTIAFSSFISSFLYGHGNMTIDNVKSISYILIMYVPGSVAYCIKNLYSKLFYIKQNTRIVLIIDVIGCFVNILLNLILVNIMGVYGLALATSLAYFITVIFQVYFANRKGYTFLKRIDLKQVLFGLCILILYSLFATYIMNNYIHQILGKIIFVMLSYILGIAFSCFNDIKMIFYHKSN